MLKNVYFCTAIKIGEIGNKNNTYKYLIKSYELVNQIFYWPQIRHEHFRLIYDSFFAFPHVDELGIGVFVGSLRQNL